MVSHLLKGLGRGMEAFGMAENKADTEGLPFES